MKSIEFFKFFRIDGAGWNVGAGARCAQEGVLACIQRDVLLVSHA